MFGFMNMFDRERDERDYAYYQVKWESQSNFHDESIIPEELDPA